MPRAHFSHVTTWVFDLDNTLYPREADLFAQIEVAMMRYIVDALSVSEAEAHRLRDLYWRDHGTTLAGLMAEHGLDPDPFLVAVHDIDLSGLTRDTELRQAIAALPGRKIVYTNGSRGHADRVVAARGLDGLFAAHYGVEDAGYAPKPRRDAFEKVFAMAKLNAAQSAMFEDDVRNLEVPHQMGMRTVLVGGADDAPHVHHHTPDLTAFLMKLA
ncbi:pyrimidine 5'-nucleotidase [Halovulum sp. GXIMD14793]